ncbi:MAG: cobalamin-binding protein [Spirochaetia bacterium]|nr:cobalamin-binding protein [Spirochaetia bacterium]
MRRTSAIFLGLLAALFVAIPSVMAQTTSQAGTGIVFKDERGVTIKLDTKAIRIVSLSPELTEILFAVGAGDKLVGNTTYCNYPEAALAVTKIGGFSAKTISVETIVSLKPDLIVGGLAAHGQLAAQFERSGLRFAALPTTGFDQIYDTIELMGRVAGNETTTKTLIATMKARIAAIDAKTKTVPIDSRPIVFWETWDEPLMSAGPGSFTGQVIVAAGGRNCFADSTADWPVVSFEAVLARNPTWIMAAESHGAALTMERLAKRPGWTALGAVKAGRVVLLDGDIVARAGPRFVDAIELMAKVLYPGSFK